MPKEQYMCQLCANHGIYNQPKKGHKQKCPHRSCPCNLCALNTKRRALDQIERQLRNANHIVEKSTKIVVEDPLPDTTSAKRISRSPSPVTAMKLAATCLPPIVKPPRTIFSANSQMPIYCVTLPATISKKALKRSVKRIEEQTKRARLLEEASESAVRLPRASIFHSAEELARSG
uniref:DM domain-containing protein n=1 Tax=Steinernema glaseri TaxID=37863 RepID=A0A1I7YC27_9BILA